MSGPGPGGGRLSGEAGRLLESLLAERRGGVAAAPTRFRLSSAQERLWRLGAMASGSAWGTLPLAFRVRGALDLAALDAALRDVMERQAILRTRYEPDGASAHGEVEPVPAAVLERDEAASMDEALARARERAVRPTDPTRDLGLAARWTATSPDEGLLTLRTHHLATDGWSLGLLLREISAAYAARVQGGAPAWTPLERSYAEIAIAEREAPAVDPDDLDYWTERLRGAPNEVPLPGRGAAAGGGEAVRAGKVTGAVDAGTAADLRALAASSGVTPFVALLTAFQTVLSRYTGERDIVVGTTVSIREGAARERLVGNFGNNVLLRARIDPDRSFRDLLDTGRETVFADLARQRFPLERLMSGNALPPRLNVLFMLRDGTPDDQFSLGIVGVRHVPLDIGASAIDLTLDVKDRGAGGFAFSIQHRIARVTGTHASDFAADLERAIVRLVAEPDTLAGEVPPLDAPWRPAPDLGRSGGEGADALEPGEARLAAIWRSALGIPDIGPHDNFFELGGHSLLAVHVLARVESELGARLTPVDLVSQTLAQLAARIAASRAEDDAAPEPGPTGVVGRLFGRGRGRG